MNGDCRCGHSSLLHGFGFGECWPCALLAATAWPDGATDCLEFTPAAAPTAETSEPAR